METRVLINPGVPDYVPKSTKSTKVEVLFYDLTGYSSRTQFLVCCFAVFVLYLLYGYLQELIFTQEGFKPYGWYLTLIQFGLYSIFGYLESLFKRNNARKIPIKIYALLAFLTLGTMGFSNSSLSHLNYPTQVIFKCCKLIPVMIGSIIIQRKKYKGLDFGAAIFMSIGLSVFTLADSRTSPNFNIFGVGMISAALLCDAVIGNVQEKFMKFYGAQSQEVVLYSYLIGFFYLLIVMCIFSDIPASVSFTMKMPIVYLYALLFSLTGYLGMQVVLTLVVTCGALTAVTVTTCRKAVSIVISFLAFHKPFSWQYVWGGLLVLIGIYLNVLSKNQIALQRLLSFSSVSLMRNFGSSLKSFVSGRKRTYSDFTV